MQKLIWSFFCSLTFFSTLTFGIHAAVQAHFGLPPYSNQIVLSYLLNFALAFGILMLLFFLRKKYSDQLGFLFMFGSFLKYAVFFVFFYPFYKADGQLERVEFFAFFIPYLVCLISETWYLIQLLNSPSKKE